MAKEPDTAKAGLAKGTKFVSRILLLSFCHPFAIILLHEKKQSMPNLLYWHLKLVMVTDEFSLLTLQPTKGNVKHDFDLIIW